MDDPQDRNKALLRDQARKRLQKKRPVQEFTKRESNELIEELIIHQEELNIQNEELRDVQLRLEVSNAKYFQLYDLAPLGYITLTPDLLIREANLGASKLLGTDRTKLINKPLSTFVSPKCHELLYLHFTRAGSEGKQQHAFKIRRDGDSEPWAQFKTNRSEDPKNGFRTIMTDVTELKRANAALKESEARYRSLFEANLDAIFLLRLDGTILSSNPAACRMFAMTEGELKHAGGGATSVSEQIARAFMEERSGGKGRTEFTFRRKDGATFVGTVFSNEFRDADGTTKVSMMIHDITERKKAEDEIKRSNDELQQFAYIASHDMEEPLRMVRSYLRLLENKNRGHLDERSLEYLNNALDGATRMQEMIHELLSYSRIGTSTDKFTLVPMEEPLGVALMNLKMDIRGRGAQVTHGALPTIRADRNQMIQLFQNLISNAIKYHGPEPPLVHVNAVRQGRDWVFSVRDNGIGIPKDQQGRLFQMFVRLHTREEYKGTGIGLALAKRIVERHGGRIWVESDVGQGSTFYFQLPADRHSIA